MCNRYISPTEAAIEREWAIGRGNPNCWWNEVLFPQGTGPFIRRKRGDSGYSRELAAGKWGLIPWFAKEAKLKYQTNNARSEELAAKASYKLPWARGQRCIIPADSFDEPCWETGKNVWWRFKRADGTPWGPCRTSRSAIAAIWAGERGPSSGSYAFCSAVSNRPRRASCKVGSGALIRLSEDGCVMAIRSVHGTRAVYGVLSLYVYLPGTQRRNRLSSSRPDASSSWP